MVKQTGHADLPLHTGTVPRWLADRMMALGTEIIEALIVNYGKKEVLRRLSDPLWFQSFGAVLGMDWHSSGITTSVMYALKRGLNARSKELGIYVCGGRGKYSRKTPEELLAISDKTGLNGDRLVTESKLCAKVDNTAVQDGFQLYQHNFILTDEGDWSVVQQGMNVGAKAARRYHWCSANLRSFVEEPHSGVTGENRGFILNLTDSDAKPTREGILELTNDSPGRIIKEIKDIIRLEHPLSKEVPGQLSLFEDERTVVMRTGGGGGITGDVTARSGDGSASCVRGLVAGGAVGAISGVLTERGLSGVFNGRQEAVSGQWSSGARNCIMPEHHEVRAEDVDLKRLGGVLTTAYESEPKDFESLLLTPGLGPRTLQSLTLVSEVIHGTPSRFRDPARFSFAHGGKDGHPFPVPLRIYDESIRILSDAVEKSKLGYNDKSECLKRLHTTAVQIEKNCSPLADFDEALAHERLHSNEWGGRTVMD